MHMRFVREILDWSDFQQSEPCILNAANGNEPSFATSYTLASLLAVSIALNAVSVYCVARVPFLRGVVGHVFRNTVNNLRHIIFGQGLANETEPKIEMRYDGVNRVTAVMQPNLRSPGPSIIDCEAVVIDIDRNGSETEHGENHQTCGSSGCMVLQLGSNERTMMSV